MIGTTAYCSYIKFKSCSSHAQCDDSNDETLDLCKMDDRIEEYSCENIQNGCLSDVDCSDDDIETSDYCKLSTNKCSAYNSEVLKYPGNGFNTYMSYVNNINVIGHLKNGETEKFNINVETGEVKDGLNSNALIVFNIYEDTYKLEKDNMEWKRIPENFETYNPDYIEEDMFLFQTLFSIEEKRYMTPDYTKCSFKKLNVGDWENRINPVSDWKGLADEIKYVPNEYVANSYVIKR